MRSLSSLCKRPSLWLALVSLTFLSNLWVAVVTLHGHNDNEGVLLRGFSTTSGAPPIVTERQYWHRMLLLQQAKKTESCTNSTESATFFCDIQEYVQRHPNAQACVPPPNDKTAICDLQATTQYSVVLYSQVQSNDESSIRRLVTKLMALIAYPSVKDIHLILPNNRTLQETPKYPTNKSKKYTQRLRQWQQRGVVNILPSSSLWDGIAHVRPETDAVLWIDGDQRKDWNGTQFKTQFQAWRQSPYLLGVREYVYVVDDINNSQRGCLLPNLHGLMMHSSLLCLLAHPVIERLRDAVGNDWNSMPMAMTQLLLVASANDGDHATLFAMGNSTIPQNSNLLQLDDKVRRYYGYPCATEVDKTNAMIDC